MNTTYLSKPTKRHYKMAVFVYFLITLCVCVCTAKCELWISQRQTQRNMNNMKCIYTFHIQIEMKANRTNGYIHKTETKLPKKKMGLIQRTLW